ncbi:MAG: metallophosphoesterase [Candidatus Eisenbacteria bacterium]
MRCFFTSDLHGREARYEALFGAVSSEGPDGLFLGGDLLPRAADPEEFLAEHLFGRLRSLRGGGRAPRCFVILGNDDPRIHEEILTEAAEEGLIEYVHGRSVPFGPWFVTGYAFVPPTPFRLKDWEKYDVSRQVDPGSVSPEEGTRSVDVSLREIRYGTIAADLEELAAMSPPERTLFLFHSPPYKTALDRAALDGRMVDHAPLDVHVGSVAIARFIEEKQPRVTLHGHVHEAPRLSGRWRERIGETHAFTGCHDGRGIGLVRFDPDRPEDATREVLGD